MARRALQVYHEEVLARERIAANGAGVRVAFVRLKLEDTAAQERKHARELREAIVRLGGAPPGPVAVLADRRPARTFESLLEDLQEEKREAAASLQAAAVAQGAGDEEAEALLRRLRDDGERHIRELVEILGRLNLNAWETARRPRATRRGGPWRRGDAAMKLVMVVLAVVLLLWGPGLAAADHEGMGLIVAAGPGRVTMVENSHRHSLVLARTTQVTDDAGNPIPVTALGAGDYVREACVPQPDGRFIAKRIVVLRPAWRELTSPEW